jgi:hypothetical protein
MTSVPASSTATPPVVPDFKNYLLAEMRCAVQRARLMQNDLEAIGTALRGDIITPDQAIESLNGCDVLRLVGTERPST